PRPRDAAGLARLHDRLNCAADDRQRARRSGAPGVGRDRLSAGPNDRHADLRQGRRPLRAKDRASIGDRAVSHRLGAVRLEPEHDPADRLSRNSGAGWRWTHRYDASGRRRYRASARAWTLSGNLRCRLRTIEHRRASARRLLHDPAVLALDFLYQPAGWYRCTGGTGSDPSITLA